MGQVAHQDIERTDMDKKKILVTPRSISKSGHSELSLLTEAGYEVLLPFPGRQPSEEELLSVIGECSVYLAGVETISRKVLDNAPLLRIISRNGVGLDNIDLPCAKEHGIEVQGTPGANSQGVAELALALLLGSARGLVEGSNTIKSGGWKRSKGMEVQGKTLGIIGCGNIGQRLARMAIGIGMNVVGYDMYQAKELEALAEFAFVEMDALLSSSDIISLHCPPTGNALVDRQFLERVKQGVIIINTARSQLVDMEAMYEALQNGTVDHYAVDAFDSEPPALNKLLLHERVTLSPHIGGFTEESIQRAIGSAVANILNILKEE